LFTKEILFVTDGRQLMKESSSERVKVNLQYFFQIAMDVSTAL